MTDPAPLHPLKPPAPPWAAERQFGLVVPIGLALLAALGWWRWDWRTTAGVLWSLAGAFLLLRFVCPRLLWPFNKLWMALAAVLGYVNTRIILAVVFYLVLTPIGRLRRWWGHDPIDRRPDPQRPSYWKPRPKEPVPPQRWERQF